MAYGRDMLRKAGSMMLDADAAYAKAVSPGRDDAFGEMTRGISLRDAFNPVNYGEPENLAERVLGTAIDVAVPAANIASRYALPVGGVTLAGAALHQLTGAFDEQTSGTLMP